MRRWGSQVHARRSATSRRQRRWRGLGGRRCCCWGGRRRRPSPAWRWVLRHTRVIYVCDLTGLPPTPTPSIITANQPTANQPTGLRLPAARGRHGLQQHGAPAGPDPHAGGAVAAGACGGHQICWVDRAATNFQPSSRTQHAYSASNQPNPHQTLTKRHLHPPPQDYILPTNAPPQCRHAMRQLLMLPPPPDQARQIQAACALLSGGCGLRGA